MPASAISLAEVATAAADGPAPRRRSTASLEVAITYDGGEGGWSGGTHCAEVEVDPGTGLVRILRYVVAEDCGELINPAIVEGQVRGGVAQGVGAVLLERSVYDESGQFLSGQLHGLPPPDRDGGPATSRSSISRPSRSTPTSTSAASAKAG